MLFRTQDAKKPTVKNATLKRAVATAEASAAVSAKAPETGEPSEPSEPQTKKPKVEQAELPVPEGVCHGIWNGFDFTELQKKLEKPDYTMDLETVL